MKYLKTVSFILILAGIASFIASYIWEALVPWGIGSLLLIIGLLGLIIFYVYLLVLKRRERPQDQAIIKKTRTPAVAGILYIIAGFLYPFLYNYFFGEIYIDWGNIIIYGMFDSESILILFIQFSPSLIGIFTGVCLLLRKFWWLSLTGAVLVFIPFIIGGYYSFLFHNFLFPPLLLLFILLFVLVLRSKKEFIQRGKI